MPPNGLVASGAVEGLRAQLAKLGHSDFVIISPSGAPAWTEGSFSDNPAKCRSAYAVVQQASGILRAGEKLKRITVKFSDGTVYVASVVSLQGKIFGVVTQKAISSS